MAGEKFSPFAPIRELLDRAEKFVLHQLPPAERERVHRRIELLSAYVVQSLEKTLPGFRGDISIETGENDVEITREILAAPISDLNFPDQSSSRVREIIQALHLEQIGDVIDIDHSKRKLKLIDIWMLPNCGKSTIQAFKLAVKSMLSFDRSLTEVEIKTITAFKAVRPNRV
jgi:hypothetical protein